MKPSTKKKLRLVLTVLVLAAVLWYARGGQGGAVQQGGGVLTLAGSGATPAPVQSIQPEDSPQIAEDGEYSGKDEVAFYIHTYGRLPDNFVTKAQARDKGWSGGSLEDFFPGCSIGGDKFGNREGLLPGKSGRQYYECDIDTAGASQRGAKRIVFSSDGLIYYTDDHYESFVLLYGEA